MDTGGDHVADIPNQVLNNISQTVDQKLQTGVQPDPTPEVDLTQQVTSVQAKPAITSQQTTQPTTIPQATTKTSTTQVSQPVKTDVVAQTSPDQSKTASVVTPTTTTQSGTTPVVTTNAESSILPALSTELYLTTNNFKDYAIKSGYNVQIIDGKVYVNNSLVDYAKLGMTLVNGQLVGSKPQYDQIIRDVTNSGFTTGETFSEYLINQGHQVTRSSDGKYMIVDGIPVDPTLYDGMTKLNGNWVGKKSAYDKMLQDALQPQKADPDFISSNGFIDYAAKKGLKVTLDSRTHLTLNGISFPEGYYPNLKWENGRYVGDEATYRKIILDASNYSQVDLTTYAKNKGYKVSSNELGYITVSKDGKVWQALHAPYWDESQGYEFGQRLTDKGWISSEAVYDQMLNEALSRHEFSLEEYASNLGYKVGKDLNGNITIDGKSIAGTSEANYAYNRGDLSAESGAHTYITTNMTVTQDNYKDLINYGHAKPTYYNDIYLVAGKFVGSEAAYKKVLQDLQSRSTQTFAQYGNASNTTVTVRNNKVYINGTMADISGTSLQIINGQVYGTDADYKALVDKANAGYKYTSPYEAQIQAALDEINEFDSYQTPQDTLNQINELMEGAKQKYNYDPTQDSALKTAQKEAERVVREQAGTRGMLYSSGTVSGAARKASELIPTYEQQAYNRWADTKNREASLLNTIMEWDNMASQRSVDTLNLVKAKFDTIIDMDSKTLEKFKAMLEQRNEDRKAALEQESMDIEQQQQALDIAWKRVESLGYVDRQASLILGVAIGTKASWAQQAALEHQNALAQLAQQNAYQIQQQNSQAAIERNLTEYKAALDEAAQTRILAQQYQNEKAIAAQNYQQQLYIARNY